MRRWLVLLFAVSLLGCAGNGARAENADARAAPVVRIPSERESDDPRPSEPPVRSDAPPAPDEDDPLPYFVGRWDGVVNEKLKTELVVGSRGDFHVHLAPQPHRPECDLSGTLRVVADVLYLDVQKSSCEAESSGTTLERQIMSRGEHEFVVKNADGSMLIRYTRQRRR